MLILTKTESACIPVERVDRKVVYPFHPLFAYNEAHNRRNRLRLSRPAAPALRCRVLAQPADAAQLQQLTSEGCTTHLAAANSGDLFDDVDVGGGIDSPVWCIGSLTRSTTGIPLPPSLADPLLLEAEWRESACRSAGAFAV